MTQSEHSYPLTYYQTITDVPAEARSSVTTDMDVDVCIIGGGLSGLCTALSLSEQGQSCIVVEKHRVAWGASGRNAGMVISGFDQSMDYVARKQGAVAARQMYGMTLTAMKQMKDRISRYRIPCGPLAEGTAIVSCYDTTDEVRKQVEHHNRLYGSQWQYWDTDATRARFKSSTLYSAIYMPESFHLQPLAYTLGIASAIENNGGRIFEQTEIIQLEKTQSHYQLSTEAGHVIKAKTVVCAGSGYLTGALPWAIKNAIMPIETYIGVTSPLSASQRAATLPCDHGAFDNRNVMNYFRMLPDNRLLWGGGHESVSFFGSSKNREEAMRRDLMKFFPSLHDVRIETIWSGLQGYSRHRMPQIREIKPGLWVHMGHGGQGLMTTTLGGELIARAITDKDPTYKLFRPYGLGFTGGTYGKIFAAGLAQWMKWQDSRSMAQFK